MPSPKEPKQGPGQGRGLFSRKNKIIVAVVIVLLAVLSYERFIAAPSTGTFEGQFKPRVITVPSGAGLSGAAHLLAEDDAVRSEFALKALIVLFGGPKGLQAGDYYFSGPENAIRVAWRLTHSLYELENVRVTIPEGLSVKEVGALLAKEPNLTHFDAAEFVDLATPHEGYLFPDTYLFLPNVTSQDVVDTMLANYARRIQTIKTDLSAFGRSTNDVITMASIVEVEARTTETREVIAGILWKRLDEGMPLQVDSAFAFVNGKKDSRDLSVADLAIPSPYNTYLNKGLPPTPISNPGLDSITAVLHPIRTEYYFYLSDAQGNMHYAVTNEEHEANKAKYLNY